MNCKKCGARLNKCTACNGGTASGMFGNKLNCNKCRSTGLQCPSHEGNWK